MRKKRLPIASALIFFVLAGLYDMTRWDRSKIPGLPQTATDDPDPAEITVTSDTPNDNLDPVKSTVIMHTPNTYLDPAKITVLTRTPNDDLGSVWSPDGDHIAFVGHHEGNPEVYVLDVSSGDLTNISNSAADDYGPLWSPDGQYLAFIRRYSQGPNHAVIRDLTVGTEVELLNDISFYVPLKWSLDSQQLIFMAYSDRACIVTYEVHSASYQNVACHHRYHSMTISPDGHWVLVQFDDTEAELVEIETGQIRTLNEVVNTWVVWAPDSHAFAYARDNSHVGLYNVSANTISHLFLWPPGVYDPRIVSWSPTGQLAWASAALAGVRTRFYVMEPLSDAFQEVARINHPIYDHSFINDIQWSPDGRYLSAFRGGNSEITLFDVDTGNVSRIRDYNNWTGPNFDWSPDGTRLVFSCGRRLATNLCMIELSES